MTTTMNRTTNGRHHAAPQSEPLDAVTGGMRAMESAYYGQCGRAVEIAREGKARIEAAAIDAARKARGEALAAARAVRDVWEGLGSFFTSLAHQLDEATLDNLAVEIEPPASPLAPVPVEEAGPFPDYVASRPPDDADEDAGPAGQDDQVDPDSPEAAGKVTAEDGWTITPLPAPRDVAIEAEVPAGADKEEVTQAVQDAAERLGGTFSAITCEVLPPEQAIDLDAPPRGPQLTAAPDTLAAAGLDPAGRPKNRGKAKRKGQP